MLVTHKCKPRLAMVKMLLASVDKMPGCEFSLLYCEMRSGKKKRKKTTQKQV
jgi:hypothetical protein